MKRLLYFTSPTCIPCKSFKPIVEQYAEEHSGEIEVIFLDLRSEGHQEEFINHNVRSVPTLILGDSRHVGTLSKDNLIKFIKENE